MQNIVQPGAGKEKWARQAPMQKVIAHIVWVRKINTVLEGRSNQGLADYYAARTRLPCKKHF